MIKDALILREPVNTSAPPRPGGSRLAGVVLLGGTVRPTRFHTAIGRSLLDLPYRQGRTLLDEWCDQTALHGRFSGGIPLRVLSDKTTHDNGMQNNRARTVALRFDSDPLQWRGTGGVLRDISAEYAPGDLLLVANAAQFLLRPLVELVAELEALRADVAVLAHRDGTPITLMLVRCGCLNVLPEVGFFDMKEQAIPLLAATHEVRALYAEQPVALGLRTATSYLTGLRALHARRNGIEGETWRSAFELIEEGGIGAGGGGEGGLDPSAKLHDSVVLREGRVGHGAVLVRSVVCPGGTVPPGTLVVDRLVTSEGQFSAEEGT